ncbi:divergent polysaccharide deacetylase family protein [Mariprofundus erugo]|uniref:Divergent polysaccharide deacetylase family protein n=1 Tax=Mariprofundus erugo TaxID=2528639 RepID=A0A5R9GX11_9PROT|nr:divergent polysaccharide deacetylase family protein [Mariprofundus erugo]TLS68567.1 divergent polysaccharide deacetylase family protein [Mariprofundus erugo]
MAAKKGQQPLWLPIALFLLLLVLVGVAVVLELGGSNKQSRPPVSQHVTPPPAHHATRQPQPAAPHAPEPVRKTVPPPTPAAPVAEPAAPVPVMPVTPATGIAFILDDAGYDIPALQRLLRLNIPIAVSVIPDAPFARKSALVAHQAGQMVMLHLPMEPESEKYRLRMSPAFLASTMDRTKIRSTFLHDLALVPYVEGVNNHMGSALTQLQQPMQWVMQVCREKGLFFVDSKTSPHSVAARAASEAGIERASRAFFLDHDVEPLPLKQAWEKARTCAKAGRRCIVIGHPHPETVAFLEQNLTDEDRAHIVPLRSMLTPANTPPHLESMVPEGYEEP